MENKQHLFVCGCARSGTSFLAKALAKSPEICIGMERYISLLIREQKLTPELFFKDRYFDVRSGDTFYSSLDRFPIYKRQYAKYDAAQYVGDKIPRLYAFVPMLIDTFGDPKIIFIIRNPYQVAASFKVRAENADDVNWSRSRSVDAAVKEWNFALRKALPFLMKRKILGIHYDDLNNHKWAWNRLGRFLGLDLTPPALGSWNQQKFVQHLTRDEVDTVRDGVDWDSLKEALPLIRPSGFMAKYSEEDHEFIDYKIATIPGLSFKVRDGSVDHRVMSLGSAATFGRFVQKPYSSFIGSSNLGVGGARPESYLKEPAVPALLAHKEHCIVEIMSARGYENDVFKPLNHLTNMVTIKKEYADLLETDDPAKPVFVDAVWRRLFRKNADLAHHVALTCQNRWLMDLRALASFCKEASVLLLTQSDLPQEVLAIEHYRFPHLITEPMLNQLAERRFLVHRVVSKAGLPQHLASPDGTRFSLMKGWPDPTLNAYYPSPEMHAEAGKVLKSFLDARAAAAVDTPAG